MKQAKVSTEVSRDDVARRLNLIQFICEDKKCQFRHLHAQNIKKRRWKDENRELRKVN